MVNTTKSDLQQVSEQSSSYANAGTSTLLKIMDWVTVLEAKDAMFLDWLYITTIRDRFIGTYCQNILQKKPQYSVISKGNKAVHEGDVEIDSLLYRDNIRSNLQVFL
ncbi:hypothetical protein GX50_02101 [[Emmonsia] crescens]|uniref:Uncharacterized protein n=1 Tax=[Emmonsia] crescens TaxID=73230 RepID=A0A2B7ZP46_9EURO|nr:hypothetical protein GX50_02101 [Emmonsia crescens]